jgi:hypothetical protein
LKNLYGLLVVASLLSSCATEQRIPAALDVKLDSALTAVGVPPLRKVKFTGPVTFQVGGTGNVATTTDASRAKAPVAAAPHATAAEAKTSVPWQVYAGGALLLVLGGFVLRSRLSF